MSQVIDFTKHRKSHNEARLKDELAKQLSAMGASDDEVEYGVSRIDYWLGFGAVSPFSLSINVALSPDAAKQVSDAIESEVVRFSEEAEALIYKMKTELILQDVNIYRLKKALGQG